MQRGESDFMETRRNDCVGCVMYEQENTVVQGALTVREYCPYNPSYPHAVNCMTAEYRIAHVTERKTPCATLS